MNHIWSLICSKAIIDQRTQMLSIFETVDVIQASGELPPDGRKKEKFIGPINIELVSFWYRENPAESEKGKFRMAILSPSGKKINQTAEEHVVNLADTKAATTILHISRLPYAGLGLYHMLVEKQDRKTKKWSKQARLPLDVKLAEEKDSKISPSPI